MKITKIIIKGFQQFENFQLDLTHPETGEPFDTVCFIGPNGTGKSTLLLLLNNLLEGFADKKIQNSRLFEGVPFFCVKCSTNSHSFFTCIIHQDSHFRIHRFAFYSSEVEDSEEWRQFILDSSQQSVPKKFCAQYLISDPPIQPLVSPNDLLIHTPADQPVRLSNNIPSTNLNHALSLFRDFPISHSVSMENTTQFWEILIYQVKKRESDFQKFLKKPENRNRTIGEVETEFEQTHPEILPKIGELWNRIFDKAGLEFDIENAQIPVQLTENLLAYVKIKTTGKQLSYNHLSSGIRNYIFKLGHICSLYFQRNIARGFLFLDEPENSLYPDLLYGLIDEYQAITQNTQMFVATHSPIIAAQFEPYARIHLDFDERGFVTTKHGVTPLDDDPNDLLIKDFGVQSVYGKEGLAKWERFLELQRSIPKAGDTTQKQQMIQEYLEIGNAYNFDPDEIPL